MANYPDWVLAHKTRGTYINKVGDRYYLYKAHSERVKGTNSVRRVCDGYIGRITEKDGLIPSRNKNPSPHIRASYELGLSYAVFFSTAKILEGLNRSYRKNGTLAYVCSVLSYVHGVYSKELFEQSALCILFPGVSFPGSFTRTVRTAIERGNRMIADHMQNVFGDDIALVRAYFPNIRLFAAGGALKMTPLGETAQALSKTYGISWEDGRWQR